MKYLNKKELQDTFLACYYDLILKFLSHFVYLLKDKATKLQLELTDLKNVEEPQSEDLKPLVCIDHFIVVSTKTRPCGSI